MDSWKSCIVCALLGLIGFHLLQAQGVPSPQIEFEDTEVHLGLVKEGDKVTHTYTFRNTGGDTLRIEKVRAS